MTERDSPDHLQRLTWVLASLVVLLLVTPIAEETGVGGEFVRVLMAFVLISTAWAFAQRTRDLVITIALAIPVLGTSLIASDPSDVAMITVGLVCGALFLGYTGWTILRGIFDAPSVSRHVIEAALVVYGAAGLMWACLYALVDLHAPGSISGTGTTMHGLSGFVQYTYFSLTTLTTLGYGDLAPTSGIARMLAVLEAIFGQVYLAVLIARLVSRYAGPSR